ncbi:hypothetical protein O6H91_05G053000 [Diphasiastrum complanatum]|uniref:Uncharacterized protein n=1 Tax=Diphasiastrum complanatum TaxID=34168 RepID=A0ACC2DNN0_DIPCM|nr:hypothetical protein O6H91_05G053000 [Diphasiastrum complanatum]
MSVTHQTQFCPLLQEKFIWHSADLLDLVSASYRKICDYIEHDRIKFNVRQVKYLVKKLLKPAMEDKVPCVTAYGRYNQSQMSEMMVECCSHTICELLKCIKFMDIWCMDRMLYLDDDIGDIRDQICLTLELDEESVNGSLHVLDEPNVIDLDTKDMQLRCGDVIDKPASGGCSIEFKVAKILFSKLGRIHQQNLTCSTIPNSPRISPKDLTQRKFLGKGRCPVFQFEWLGNIFAGKVFEAEISRDPLEFERFGRSCRREAEILSTFQHPNIVQLRGYCIDAERNTCTLLLDLMSHDLSHFLRTRTHRHPFLILKP